jgi:hypothetical protein
MEIRLSKYNSPFSEPSTADVHYISLDDQRDIRAGAFDAHVREYRAQFSMPLSFSTRTFRTDNFIEIYDPLTGATRLHDLSGTSFFAPSVTPVVDVDFSLVHQLRKAHVQAANRVTRCNCGNANRPWRCTCNK